MSEVDAIAVHHRAGTGDDADVVLTAILDGRRRDTRALPDGLMHPDAADSGIAAVPHDPLGGLRSRDDHHAVDSTRDRLQVGITAVALERLHVWVHRKDIVPTVLQAVIDQIADRVVAVVARHARNRDTLLSQTVVNS